MMVDARERYPYDFRKTMREPAALPYFERASRRRDHIHACAEGARSGLLAPARVCLRYFFFDGVSRARASAILSQT